MLLTSRRSSSSSGSTASRHSRAPCGRRPTVAWPARSAGRPASAAASALGRIPEPDREPGKVRGAERGRFGHLRPHDRHAEQVGLKLQQRVVGGGAAVDAQLASERSRRRRWTASSRSATWNAMLSRAARAMWPAVVPRVMPDDRAARVRIPVRRAQAGERRARDTRRRCRGRMRASGSTSDDCLMMPSPSRSHWTTAPPMNTLPSSAYIGPAADLPGHRREQPIARRDRLRRRCSAAGSSRCRRCSSSGPATTHIWPKSAAC